MVFTINFDRALFRTESKPLVFILWSLQTIIICTNYVTTVTIITMNYDDISENQA